MEDEILHSCPSQPSALFFIILDEAPRYRKPSERHVLVLDTSAPSDRHLKSRVIRNELHLHIYRPFAGVAPRTPDSSYGKFFRKRSTQLTVVVEGIAHLPCVGILPSPGDCGTSHHSGLGGCSMTPPWLPCTVGKLTVPAIDERFLVLQTAQLKQLRRQRALPDAVVQDYGAVSVNGERGK